MLKILFRVQGSRKNTGHCLAKADLNLCPFLWFGQNARTGKCNHYQGEGVVFSLSAMAPQVQAHSGEQPASSKAGQVPAQQPKSSKPRPVSRTPRGHAAPGPWKKSFQIALLGSDWPRRTRSRGAAANEQRRLRAQGRGRGPVVWAAPPSAAAAVVVAARLRRPSPGKCGTAAAAGGEGRWGTVAAGRKLFCPALPPDALSGPPAAAFQRPCGSPNLRVSSRLPGLRRFRALDSKIPLFWSPPS